MCIHISTTRKLCTEKKTKKSINLKRTDLCVKERRRVEMRRKIGRFMVVFVAVCMFVFSSVNVHAVSVGFEKSGTITVNTGGRDVTGQKFLIYKVMSQKTDGDKVTYSPVSDFEDFFAEKNLTDDKAALKYLEKTHVRRDLQADAREYISKYEVKVQESLKGENLVRAYTTPELDFGVYAVVPENEEYGVMFVKVDTSDENVYLAGNEPGITKVVDGKNWECVQIGQKLKFKVTSSVPNMGDAASYTFRIEDTMSEALNLSKDTLNLAVSIGDKKLEEGTDYTVEIKDRLLKIDFINFVQYKADFGETIRVKYETALNEQVNTRDAVANKSNVYYGVSNDSVQAGIPASVNLRTADLKINATDEPGVGLAGATFELHEGKDVYGEIVKVAKVEEGKYKVCSAENKEAVTEMTSGEDGKIVVEGVGAGDYSVMQTGAPDNFDAKTKTATTHIDASSTDKGFKMTVTGNSVKMVSAAQKISEKGKIMIGAVVVAVLIGLGYMAYSARKKSKK